MSVKKIVLFVGCSIAVVLIPISYANIIRSHGEENYGKILVEGPQIYTRERLVNDRYREDAWLLKKLKVAQPIDFKPQVILDSSKNTHLSGLASVQLPGATVPGAESSAEGATGNGAQASGSSQDGHRDHQPGTSPA